MAVITLNIPEEIDKELIKLRVKREDFLLEALKEKIKFEKDSNLNDLLAEGYRERRTENELLSKDFFHSDLENWNEY
jgi:hypothetical protein